MDSLGPTYIFKDSDTGAILLTKTFTTLPFMTISVPGLDIIVLSSTSPKDAHPNEDAETSMPANPRKLRLAKKVMAVFLNIQIQMERIYRERSPQSLETALFSSHGFTPNEALPILEMAETEVRLFQEKAQRTLDAWSRAASQTHSVEDVDKFFRAIQDETVMGPYALANQLDEETL